MVLLELGRLAAERYGSRLTVAGSTFALDGIRLHLRVQTRGKSICVSVGEESVCGLPDAFPYAEALEVIESALATEKKARTVFETRA